jgi:hypothetical protein
MGLDMYLMTIPKVDSIEELREFEVRLSDAYYAGDGELEKELNKIQKEKNFKNPIFYKIDTWPENKEDYEKYKACGDHIVKISLTKDVGYWHKFSSLHEWFVEYCQDGVDDCYKYIVDIEVLKALLYKLANINKKNAGDILPYAKGYSYKYDEHYFQRVDELKLFIMTLIEENDFEEKTLIYQSSW